MTSKNQEEKTPKHTRRHARRKLDEFLSEDDKSMVSSILKKKGKLSACPNCGGLDLSDPPGGEKASKSGMYYCIDCKFIGEPKTFEHEKAYVKFYAFKREKYNEGLDEVADKKIRPVAKLKEEPNNKPYIAAWLSVVLPGLGQAYNSQMVKGGTLGIIYVLLFSYLLGVFSRSGALIPDLNSIIAAALLIMVYASGDAYNVALRETRVVG